MLNSISNITCGNIYSILTELNMFDKIPEDKRVYIIKHKGNYELKFNKKVPLQFQIEDKETMVVLSYLFFKYINKDVNTKKFVLDKYTKNEILYQEKIKEKYNSDNIFKNAKKEMSIENVMKINEVALVEVKDNVINRIIKKIKNFFRGIN